MGGPEGFEGPALLVLLLSGVAGRDLSIGARYGMYDSGRVVNRLRWGAWLFFFAGPDIADRFCWEQETGVWVWDLRAACSVESSEFGEVGKSKSDKLNWWFISSAATHTQSDERGSRFTCSSVKIS